MARVVSVRVPPHPARAAAPSPFRRRAVHFRALDSKRAATAPPARPAAPAVQTNGAATFKAPNPSQPTGQDNVLAFMEQHRDAWLKAAAINRGMGLSSDHTVSVISALNRLVKKGALQKDNNARFCLPSPTRGNLEVTSR